MKISKNLTAIMLLLMLLPALCFAQQVLVWDFDNGYTIPDPDGTGLYGVQRGVVKALRANGITPTLQTSLPAELSGYDAVFVVCGVWYPSCFS